ncbi:MAG: amidase [Acidimicrobiales bacterium]|nr:MAG: amidase [Acidimicrobiales bacterium]
MSTFITQLDDCGVLSQPRLAVKDVIDVAGVPTTAGSRVVAEMARPAVADAPCLAGARQAGVHIVGKANLVELALGTVGINPWFGTPVNPLDRRVVPGGSSSGCAVAVATGEAEVGYGTDTGGSIRVPAACCGIAGLKTTWGRIPTGGVWPLAPSLDTVGPMAADVDGLILGMGWLEPGFAPAQSQPRRVGRFRLAAEPLIDQAVDDALDASGFEVTDVSLPGWGRAWELAGWILVAEAAVSNAHLVRQWDQLDPVVAARLEEGRRVGPAQLEEARAFQAGWKAAFLELLTTVELVALPTMTRFPPLLEDAGRVSLAIATRPVNLAGLPALAVPVPSHGRLPASLQLIGPPDAEELLLAAGLVVERGVG